MSGRGLRIQVRGKRFAGVPVLDDIRIDVADGEFVALVGPSGAGKSTLLNLVAGLDTDFDGDIRYNGAPLAASGRSPLGMGMMFQQPRLMPWLCARDNVMLAEAECMQREPGYVSRADGLLAEVGLGESGDAWPSQLSGGMQRRVALARAFVIQPWLLLLDEPFVSLDMPTGNRLRQSLRTLCARQRPLVLFVTHDLREALALADRILFLGGSPARIRLDYRVPITGERDLEGMAVAGAQRALLERHPQLLSGVLSAPGIESSDREKP